MSQEEATRGQVLTVEEIAQRLKVSPATVYTLLRRKDISSFRVGRGWRVEGGDLDAYIRRQKTPAAGRPVRQESRRGK